MRLHKQAGSFWLPLYNFLCIASMQMQHTMNTRTGLGCGSVVEHCLAACCPGFHPQRHRNKWNRIGDTMDECEKQKETQQGRQIRKMNSKAHHHLAQHLIPEQGFSANRTFLTCVLMVSISYLLVFVCFIVCYYCCWFWRGLFVGGYLSVPGCLDQK